MTIPSYRVRLNDVIEVKESSRQLVLVIEASKSAERDVPDYIEADHNKMTAKLLRVPALHKDGHSLSIAFTVGLLKDEGGAVTGIVAVIRDETERWSEEKRLRQRISDLEAESKQCIPT